MWSRVKSREMMGAQRMVVFDLDDDIKKLKKSDEFKFWNENQ